MHLNYCDMLNVIVIEGAAVGKKEEPFQCCKKMRHHRMSARTLAFSQMKKCAL